MTSEETERIHTSSRLIEAESAGLGVKLYGVGAYDNGRCVYIMHHLRVETIPSINELMMPRRGVRRTQLVSQSPQTRYPPGGLSSADKKWSVLFFFARDILENLDENNL